MFSVRILADQVDKNISRHNMGLYIPHIHAEILETRPVGKNFTSTFWFQSGEIRTIEGKIFSLNNADQ